MTTTKDTTFSIVEESNAFHACRAYSSYDLTIAVEERV